MRNEEEDLRARFGTVFDEYAAKVPLFLPDFFGTGYMQPPTAKSSEAFSLATLSPQPRIQSPDRHHSRPGSSLAPHVARNAATDIN